MEVNRSPDKPVSKARFRRGPGASQAVAETWMYATHTADCKNCSEIPCRCRCSSVVSLSQAQDQTQTDQRSDLFGVCLNCPIIRDDQGRTPCSSCSAIPAASASLDRSSVMTTAAPSVYNGRTVSTSAAGFTEFQKPSTATAMAMSMSGAEEATIYNGKIGCSLFSGHQLSPIRTANNADDARNEAIFDENICREGRISFRKSPSSTSLTIHDHIHTTSLLSDKMSNDWPGQSKRSWQVDMTEDRTTQLPEKDTVQFGSASVTISSSMQEYSGMAVQLPAPAPAHTSSSSCMKRRRMERTHVCVPVNTENSQVPSDPDGYKWWKCGRKVIKGSPYARSYYKCMTGNNCHAKRGVMIAIDDPSMLNITYYGWHNHASPAPAVASAASDIVPAGIRPVEPVEEFATAKPNNFIEYL